MKNSNAELIVVDDGSNDKTAEIAEKTCAEFPGIETKVIRYEKNRGKGYAVKTGLLAARADIALFSAMPIFQRRSRNFPNSSNRFKRANSM